jgi:hypothetical protein
MNIFGDDEYKDLSGEEELLLAEELERSSIFGMDSSKEEESSYNLVLAPEQLRSILKQRGLDFNEERFRAFFSAHFNNNPNAQLKQMTMYGWVCTHVNALALQAVFRVRREQHPADFAEVIKQDLERTDHFSARVAAATPLIVGVADKAHGFVRPGSNVVNFHLHDQIACLDLLATMKADVNQRDCVGRTALHYAVDRADLALVGVLLAVGADKTVQDHKGKTPYDHATNNLSKAEAHGNDTETLTVIQRMLDPSIGAGGGGGSSSSSGTACSLFPRVG